MGRVRIPDRTLEGHLEKHRQMGMLSGPREARQVAPGEAEVKPHLVGTHSQAGSGDRSEIRIREGS